VLRDIVAALLRAAALMRYFHCACALFHAAAFHFSCYAATLCCCRAAITMLRQRHAARFFF